jgi:hypothetical protein
MQLLSDLLCLCVIYYCLETVSINNNHTYYTTHTGVDKHRYPVVEPEFLWSLGEI